MRSKGWLGLVFVFCTACGEGRASSEPHVAGHGGHEGHGAHGAHGAHGPLVHRFENAEEWAKRFDDPARDAWQRPQEIIAAMQLAPGMTVADLGAGTGYFEPYLSRAVGATGSVLALDIEPDMVRYLGERATRESLANVRAILVAPGDPKLPPASVDRILAVDVWHHMPERVAYGAKLREALKVGGKLYVVDFKLDAKHGPPPHHRLAPAQVLEELTSAGLIAELSPTSLTEQYIVIGTRPGP